MPISINSQEDLTIIAFQGRCAQEDVEEVLGRLRESLAIAPRLRFETAGAESLDTSAVQFSLSAIASCERFESSDDRFFQTILERWGISKPF